MPLAVIVAASVTIRPDARATWIIGLPFFALAFMFITNYDSNHLVAWYGGEELPLKYRFAATWAARRPNSVMGCLDGTTLHNLEEKHTWRRRDISNYAIEIDERLCSNLVISRMDP